MGLVLLDDIKHITTMDQKIAEWFNSNFGLGGSWPWGNLLLCVLAIALSVLLCGMVGLEREKRGRSAGLRTHLLVGVGSCIVMIISIYGFPSSFTRDPARLAAQAVTGVGFLGAGAIIHSNGGIKGLTTAGTVWLVMAIGLACGSMNFLLALISSCAVMVVLVSFRRVERMVTKNNPMIIMLSPSETPVMTELLAVAKENNCSVTDITSQIVQDGEKRCIELIFKISSTNNAEIDIPKFVSDLEERTHAFSVQVLNHH